MRNGARRRASSRGTDCATAHNPSLLLQAGLWPQILNEAFARAVAKVVQSTHQAEHLAVTRLAVLADPSADEVGTE